MRVKANQISVKRGEDQIFDPVSFELDEGQSLIVTGPNGVGKSTLLRALAGLLNFETGIFEIENGAQDDNYAFGHAREKCHYLGHQNAMKTELTVLQNLEFWQQAMSGSCSGKEGGSLMSAEEACEALGLVHTLDLPFGFLSQGQRRRISLAKLFVSYRPVWLLDEPTAALDKASTQKFVELANNHLTVGGVIIAATHEPLDLIHATGIELSPAVIRASEF